MNQQEVLNKYTHTEVAKAPYYKTISKSVFALRLPVDALGLFIYLRSISGRNSFYENTSSIPGISISNLAARLGWTRQQTKIKELLQTLSAANLIEVVQQPNKLIDIVLDDDNAKESGTFVKLYAPTFRKITNGSTGKALLVRLAVYAAFRSSIFENGSAFNVFARSINYIATTSNVSYSSVARHLSWFRDCDVLAYYLCKTSLSSGDITGKRYIYADYHDKDLLTKKVQQGHIGGLYINQVLE